jgi:hypothetical protein
VDAPEVFKLDRAMRTRESEGRRRRDRAMVEGTSVLFPIALSKLAATQPMSRTGKEGKRGGSGSPFDLSLSIALCCVTAYSAPPSTALADSPFPLRFSLRLCRSLASLFALLFAANREARKGAKATKNGMRMHLRSLPPSTPLSHRPLLLPFPSKCPPRPIISLPASLLASL